jgi:hypothetical protein
MLENSLGSAAAAVRVAHYTTTYAYRKPLLQISRIDRRRSLHFLLGLFDLQCCHNSFISYVGIAPQLTKPQASQTYFGWFLASLGRALSAMIDR